MSILDTVFGKKPKVAKYKPLEPTSYVGDKLIPGNIANFPEISKLADLYSTQELSQLEKLFPDYAKTAAAGQEATGALFEGALPLLHGEIPQDVQDAIQRSSAYQSLSGGYYGSPMARALTARDLGRTSLDMMNQGAALQGQGLNSMQAWDAMIKGHTLPTSSMLVSPQLGLQINEEERLRGYNARQAAYNMAAQPDPGIAGIHNTVMTLLEAYLGTMGGRGPSGPDSGGPTNTSGVPYNAVQSWQSNAASYGGGGFAPTSFNYVPTNYVNPFGSGGGYDPTAYLYGG